MADCPRLFQLHLVQFLVLGQPEAKTLFLYRVVSLREEGVLTLFGH